VFIHTAVHSSTFYVRGVSAFPSLFPKFRAFSFPAVYFLAHRFSNYGFFTPSSASENRRVSQSPARLREVRFQVAITSLSPCFLREAFPRCNDPLCDKASGQIPYLFFCNTDLIPFCSLRSETCISCRLDLREIPHLRRSRSFQFF